MCFYLNHSWARRLLWLSSLRMGGKMHDTNDVEKDVVPTELLANSDYRLSKKCSSIRVQSANRYTMQPFYSSIRIATLVIAVCIVIVLITLLATGAKFHQKSSECLEPACPDNWIGFQRKCFYFSDDTKNWTFSKRFCESQDADLAQVETLQELGFPWTCRSWSPAMYLITKPQIHEATELK
ncbi:PREDICTED: C-type lectin domain family 2 member D-like isoform X1 [Hipposideros armiger]|uniref:C-type lectin domain family 2 member D-like isoform X1 n=1 Tax=Hipposideros armiger TaxID=186990 RepID=A0A8B7QK84_HIPAR|nr:PREDICTED: C-type lectin domain family 2 member D-like isoform X1 [Hipposideros armiger]